MSSPRVTIRDVAGRAGVSVQTVSNLLNGRDFAMRPETRDRVYQAMAELQYVPSHTARNLRRQRSGQIAFFTFDPSPRPFSDPFHGEVISGMADAARSQGSSVLIHAESSGTLEPLHRLALEQRADAAVVNLAHVVPDYAALHAALAECPMPLVLLEDQIETPSATYVMGDNYNGGMDAVRFLLAGGHRRIGFVAGSVDWPAVARRRDGYRAALEAAGIAPRPDWVEAGAWTPAGGYEAGLRLLRQAPDLTAVFAANDLLAIGVLDAARFLGRTPGRDLAVVGYDDFAFASYVDPPLTTVELPAYEMGRRAAELLLHYLSEGDFPMRGVVLPYTLRVRNSA